MTNDEQNYDMCFRVENVVLPKNGYFGMSAATGGLADDHDVLHFLTNSLYPAEQQAPPQGFEGNNYMTISIKLIKSLLSEKPVLIFNHWHRYFIKINCN